MRAQLAAHTHRQARARRSVYKRNPTGVLGLRGARLCEDIILYCTRLDLAVERLQDRVHTVNNGLI